ncbi:MAG: NAD(P)-dependent alcohol dehydrogenase [Candidatus Gracilibacteria bacterium]|nr:NAD(P)-dependent alcohol dehydrogenase [Candidatus Gracilibacteria bacterium]
MKAIIQKKYGGPEVLQLTEVEKPVAKDDEVLVEIQAATVARSETMMRTGKPLIGRLFTGINGPKNLVPGTGFSGRIVAVGKEVTEFKKGDEVFGESTFTAGTYAEYLAIKAVGLIEKKPKNLSFDQASTLCDGPLTSYSFLKDVGNLRAGQKVLINGASGSLGTAAVQLAKNIGAKVTAVCSTKNVEMVKDLRADEVVDYKEIDFTKTHERYDLIFDTIGVSSFLTCKPILTETGVYMAPAMEKGVLLFLFQIMWTFVFGKKKAKFSSTGARPLPKLKILLAELKKMAEQEKLKVVIDKTYPLEQIVAAHQYVDSGHKKGNVVIKPKTD